MRLLLFVAAILLVTVWIGTRAKAQNYPWCAYYSVNGAAENCGFVSFQQCMTTLRGIGGICMRNTQYVPGSTPGPHYWLRRTRHQHS